MKKVYQLVILVFLSIPLLGQRYTISGYISSAGSGEKLIAASVFDSKSLEGTVSNTYGFYSISLERGKVNLEVSYLGHKKIVREIDLRKDIEINFDLENITELDMIEIIAERQAKIEQETQMSKIEVPVDQIRKIPALLGEVDVLKTIQLLPGVQSGGEGQTGLYIRGGSPDQNLILLDGVPIYNVSHFLGIFSVFNADAIKTVTLTKGGFPARYGGRLSSVLEINMKDGHMNEFHGQGSIGAISSKLSLEGPIIKDKTSFIVSGRRTYWDLIFLKLIPALNPEITFDDTDIDLFFYDVNAKINHKFNDDHRLYLSYYQGSDEFSTSYRDTYDGFIDRFKFGLDWGNFVSSLRWNYRMSNKLFANTTLTYSDYDLDIISLIEEHFDDEFYKYSAAYLSGIRDFGAKIDFDYVPQPNHYIKFGVGATHHTYTPGALTLELEDSEFQLDTLLGHRPAYSMEYDIYVEDEMKFGALKANLGLHASAFKVDDAFYTSLQPRINLRYLLSNDIALKGSFATMSQYLNLLTSEALALPSDLWVPSTAAIKPQESWQAAVGIAKSFGSEIEVSIEGYYKSMDNVISYLPGENFLTSFEEEVLGETKWEGKITQGSGESYGAEVFIQKKQGRTTGWIGYTLSWNWRQFDEINGGKRFPYRYDRRHDISFVLSHELSERWSASASWVYGTGNAVTLPTYQYPTPSGQHYYGGFDSFEGLGEKNAFRMSDYHRLDLSFEYRKPKKWGESAWIFSIYNAYIHNNPYFIIPDYEYDPQSGEYRQSFQEVSILPIIPTISYSFKF